MTEDTLSGSNQQSEPIYESQRDYISPSIYDPFGQPKDDDFKPNSQETYQIHHISCIMRDIRLLYDIIGKLKNKQEKKLLVKYIIIEWASLDKILREFASSLILQTKTGLINPEEFQILEQLKQLKQAYEQACKPHQKLLKDIRNKLAAHREELDLEDIAILWQSINLDDYIDILNAAVKFHNFVVDLDIHSWFKVQNTSQGEMIALVQPGTGIWLDDESK